MKTTLLAAAALGLLTADAQATVTYHRQIGSFENSYGNDATGNTTFDTHTFATNDGGVGIYDVKSLGGQDLFYGQVTSTFSSVLLQNVIIVASSMVYNGTLADGSYTPDPTNREFRSSMSWEVIFSWNGGLATVNTPGSDFGAWSSAKFESGTYVGNTWTILSTEADILNLSGPSQGLNLAAGTYRVTCEYDTSFYASGAFARGNANTVYLAENPVPEPGSLAALALGLFAARRRRRQ